MLLSSLLVLATLVAGKPVQSAPSPDVSDQIASVRALKLNRSKGSAAFQVEASLSYRPAEKSAAVMGTYKETWIDMDHWRAEFTLGSSSATELQAGEKFFSLHTGDSPIALQFLRTAILGDAPMHPRVSRSELVKIQDMQLLRLGEQSRNTQNAIEPYASAWYVNPATSHVVALMAGPWLVNYTNAGTIAGKWVPLSVSAFDPDGEVLEASNIDWKLNVSSTSLDANPPPGATAKEESPTLADPPTLKTIHVSSGIAAGMRFGGNTPVYPTEAKVRHVEGAVMVEAVIGRDGKIHNPVVVSSPDKSLSISALQAVRSYQYRPYLVAGEPTEVSTTIVMTYRLQ